MDEQHEIVEILRQIREEAKETTTRVAELSSHLKIYVDRLNETTCRQVDGELRLRMEVTSLSDLKWQVRDTLSRLEDHHVLLQHEERIRELEKRIGDHPSD